MVTNNCPAYQETQLQGVRCFITNSVCNYEDFHNCPEYQTHLQRVTEEDVLRTLNPNVSVLGLDKILRDLEI